VFVLTVGRFVSIGSRLRVSYLGSVCELDVVEMIVENGETVGADDTQITDRLASVSLSQPPDMCHRYPCRRFFRCVNGTTVTLYKSSCSGNASTPSVVTLDDVAGADRQRDFLMRLVSAMLNVDKANIVKRSGKSHIYTVFRKKNTHMCFHIFENMFQLVVKISVYDRQILVKQSMLKLNIFYKR